MQDLKDVVKPFYTACLTANSGVDVQAVIDTLLADNFQNINTAQRLDKNSFKGYVPGTSVVTTCLTGCPLRPSNEGQ